MIPVRYLADVLGLASEWTPNTSTILLTGQNLTEVLVVGSDSLTYTGLMDTAPAVIPPGRTMLPARYVAQIAGYNVTWDATNQTVTVTPAR
jgi:hypothetical protein